VESILQVSTITGPYILGRTPSNGACDILAHKLIQRCKKQLLCLHSCSRNLAGVPEELCDYSNYKKEKAYTPDAKQLAHYQIMCVLFNPGRLLV
jgi:hypothetical protein